jgi:hypothetical protein
VDNLWIIFKKGLSVLFFRISSLDHNKKRRRVVVVVVIVKTCGKPVHSKGFLRKSSNKFKDKKKETVDKSSQDFFWMIN